MKRIYFSALFLVAALLVLVAAVVPLDSTNDSRAYFASAERLLAGDFAIPADWPPLYPVALAVLHFLSEAKMVSLAGFLNLIGALLILYALHRWFRGVPAVVAALLVFASPVFLFIYSSVWTEPLFLGFVALFLCYATPEQSGKMTVLAALATLTRYTGVTLIAAGFLLLVYRRHYRDAVTFAATSSLPLALWLARNYRLTGTLTGERTPSSHTLGYNLTMTGISLGGMVIPLALLVLLPWALWRNQEGVRAALPALLFATVYLAFLIVTSTLSHYDAINPRLVAPVLPAAAITAVMLGTAHKAPRSSPTGSGRNLAPT